MNHFNMLQNSDFRADTSEWVFGYPSEFSFISVEPLPSNVESFLSGYALRLTGLYYANIDVYQEFRCFGHVGDRFTAGGWCCAYAKRNHGTNDVTACRIRVQFHAGYGDWIDGGVIDWNSTEGEWQFASTSVYAPMDFVKIRFRIEYFRQVNYADFSNLFLYPEQFATEYVYDENGNSTSVTPLFGKPSGSHYDDYNNLTSYTAPGCTAGYTYNYGSTTAEKKKHLLLKSTTPLGTVTDYTYNGSGNPTQVRMKDADTASAKFIQTDTAYTADGNYTATQTDARGKTLTTVTDGNKGTVTSVTDPNGQIVYYSYDSLRRLTKVQTVDHYKIYQNSYVYDADTGAETADITVGSHNLC